jgi:hypothetical protein
MIWIVQRWHSRLYLNVMIYIVHLFPPMCRIKQYRCLRWISYSMAATCCSFSSFPPPIPKKIAPRGAVVMLKFPFGRAETCPSRLTAVKTGNRCCWDHTGSKSIIKFRYKRECHLWGDAYNYLEHCILGHKTSWHKISKVRTTNCI